MAPIRRQRKPASTTSNQVAPTSQTIFKEFALNSRPESENIPAPVLFGGAEPEPHDVSSRVWQVAEQLAEQLDKWTTEHADPQTAAKSFTHECLEVAESSIAASNARKGSQLPSGRSTRLFRRSEDSASEETQWKWQEEANTWAFFEIMLDSISSDEANKENVQTTNADDLPSLSQFSSETNLWRHFIEEDLTAKELDGVVRCLEKMKAQNTPDFQALLEQVENDISRQNAPSSQGWLSTREQIKMTKRLRTTKNPLPNALPNVRSANGTKTLVSSLDPDAPMREDRALEDDDENVDRAMWATCWEMLSRGQDPKEFQERFENRKISWLTASIGMGSDIQNGAGRFQGKDNGTLWRKMCRLASLNTAASDYERAVYGYLGGRTEPVENVAQSWHDMIHAYYNSRLLRRFDDWLAHRASGSTAPFEEANIDSVDLIKDLKRDKRFGTEANEPLNLIQGSILSKNITPLVRRLSLAISKLAHPEPNTATYIPTRDNIPDDLGPELQMAQDPNVLRIIAHLVIILEDMDPGKYFSSPDLQRDREVLITAYIDILRKAGKIELIPIYCLKVSAKQRQTILAHVLVDIQDGQERARMLSLFSMYEFDTLGILTEHLDRCLALVEGKAEDWPVVSTKNIPAPWPGVRLNHELVGPNPSEIDAPIIGACDYFWQLDGHYEETFSMLTDASRFLLIQGRMDLAIRLTTRMSAGEVSKSKTADLVGFTVDVTEAEGWNSDEETKVDGRGGRVTRSVSQRSPSQLRHERKRVTELLQDIAQGYMDVEILCHAAAVLSDWRVLEQKAEKRGPEVYRFPDMLKNEALDTIHLVHLGCQPLLAPDFLGKPRDKDEGKELSIIRSKWLVPLVLAYHSSLHFAALTLRRPDLLLDCLDLAPLIAEPQRTHRALRGDNLLANAFVTTGYISTLVRAMALTSKAMLGFQEASSKSSSTGKAKRGSKGRKSETFRGKAERQMGIWDVHV